MGAIERTWGLHVPSAAALLGATAELGMRHWYSALRYAVILGNLVSSTVTSPITGMKAISSAFQRFFGITPMGNHLHVYGAPVRYHLDESMRDSKFAERAEAAYYVGPSPENPSEKWLWTGTRHLSCGGSFVID